MSKAFTKEDDGGGVPQLPDLPVSEHPNHVTPRGLALLKGREAELEAEISELREMRETMDDLTPLAVAERDLRYVTSRLASAILVNPPDEPVEQVQFGATVTVADEDGQEARYTIVGEDEADPDNGLIAVFSPLARALMEAQVGDVVEWPRPAGMVELEILEIQFS